MRDGPGVNKWIRLLKAALPGRPAAAPAPGRLSKVCIYVACEKDIDDLQIRYAAAARAVRSARDILVIVARTHAPYQMGVERRLQ